MSTRNPRRPYAPLLLALAALAAAAALPGAAAAADKDKILIGATLPLTGAEARVGGFFKEGYDLAFEQVSKAGGLEVGGKKLPVQFLLLDDTSTQASAVSLADRLVNSDRVDFLLGTYASHLVEAQSTVAEQNRVPYVNGGGGATKIYKRKFKYLFGLISPVELLGGTLMQWMDEQQKAGKLPKPAKIALLWENTAHGKDFRKGVSDFAGKSGGAYQVVVDESFELNARDFGALLGKVKAANVDLFLVDAHLPDYITMHRQYVANGMCHKVVSYGARGGEKDAVKALGQENVNYVLSGVWWNAQLGTKPGPSQEFVKAFKAKYGGREPEWFQALAYESARALFTAIQQAGKVDREAVRAKLASMKMPSLLPGGTLEFKAEFGQQAQNSFVVQQNQPDGTSPIIFPKDVASAAGVAPNPRCAK
ncbi:MULTISPECIES: amino acid ABC transporter substrate-binding protein [Anaeromyxobacter]|uniref:amino acid ABC transporter substrate-binding protein n=1 Tax=Anaeromyxobacter TaxID=161492 RepID=UPI001F59BA3E|nr:MULTISPECIES: amino acid ABC transporter substrate-binding protein [unclassified Anaeromyxobacter]